MIKFQCNINTIKNNRNLRTIKFKLFVTQYLSHMLYIRQKLTNIELAKNRKKLINRISMLTCYIKLERKFKYYIELAKKNLLIN